MFVTRTRRALLRSMGQSSAPAISTASLAKIENIRTAIADEGRQVLKPRLRILRLSDVFPRR